jgi:hypothetical protein
MCSSTDCVLLRNHFSGLHLHRLYLCYRYVVVGFLSAKHLYVSRSAQPKEQTATQPRKSRIDASSNLLNYGSGESDITIFPKAR